MKKETENQTKLEKSTHDKEVIFITYFAEIFFAVLIVAFIISLPDLRFNIFYMCAAGGLTVVEVIMLYKELKYRDTNSKVIVDMKGVRYFSKAAKYFIPWERVQRVEIIWVHLKSMSLEPKPYFVFFTDHSKQCRLGLKAKNVSDEFLYVHYDKEIGDYIKHLEKSGVKRGLVKPEQQRKAKTAKKTHYAKMGTKTHDKVTIVTTFCFQSLFIAMAIGMVFVSFIDNILYACGAIGLIVIGIVELYKEHKYRDTNSNVIIDTEGVRYHSKAAEHFIPWERVHRIEGVTTRKKASISCDGFKPYILFISDSQCPRDILPKNISDDFIYVHYDKEIEDFLERQCRRWISDRTNRFVKYREKGKRQRQTARKKNR